MNKVIVMGRLVRDPETRFSPEGVGVSKYTLAVDRVSKQDGQPTADFIPCIAFRKSSDFAEKYLRKGMKIAVTGHIQTGSYTNKDGQKVYTTDIVVETQEFCESRSTTGTQEERPQAVPDATGFMIIPEGIDEELPFS